MWTTSLPLAAIGYMWLAAAFVEARTRYTVPVATVTAAAVSILAYRMLLAFLSDLLDLCCYQTALYGPLAESILVAACFAFVGVVRAFRPLNCRAIRAWTAALRGVAAYAVVPFLLELTMPLPKSTWLLVTLHLSVQTIAVAASVLLTMQGIPGTQYSITRRNRRDRIR